MNTQAESHTIVQLPERLYTLAVACELIPMPSIGALYQFLYYHKAEFPARYRNTRWYEVRMLTISEINRIREMTIHGIENSRYGLPGHGRPRRTVSGPLGRIIRMAST